MNLRPGPTSTRWMVAFANLTVAPGDRGRNTGEVGCETVPLPSCSELAKEGSVGVRGVSPVTAAKSPDPGLAAEVEYERICLGRGLAPSGLATRRIDFGIGGGELGRPCQHGTQCDLSRSSYLGVFGS